MFSENWIGSLGTVASVVSTAASLIASRITDKVQVLNKNKTYYIQLGQPRMGSYSKPLIHLNI